MAASISPDAHDDRSAPAMPPVRRPPVRRKRPATMPPASRSKGPMWLVAAALIALAAFGWMYRRQRVAFMEPSPARAEGVRPEQAPPAEHRMLRALLREALDAGDAAAVRPLLARAEAEGLDTAAERAALAQLVTDRLQRTADAYARALAAEDVDAMTLSRDELAAQAADDPRLAAWDAEIEDLRTRLATEAQAVALGDRYRVLLQNKQYYEAGLVLDDLAKLGESVRSERARWIKSVSLGKAVLRLRYIPPGTFTMGSPADEAQRDDDETPHQVRLTQGFWLGETEITQAQWSALLDDAPSEHEGPTLPVESVAMVQVAQFLEALNAHTGLNFRLPTEAEWEYAARAGGTEAFGTGASLGGRQANIDGRKPYGKAAAGPYLGATAPVGGYPPNAWGLRDMYGNVWEWTADKFEAYPSEPVVDPNPSSFLSKYQVVRGGGWADDAHACRAANRYTFPPQTRLNNLGFRVLLPKQ